MLEDKIKLEDLAPIISLRKLDEHKELYSEFRASFIRKYNLYTLPIWSSILTFTINYGIYLIS